LKQKAEVWETIERKWAEALLLYKQQHEALASQVKALIKEKKKENVLIDYTIILVTNSTTLMGTTETIGF
jgi:hypothetical protein